MIHLQLLKADASHVNQLRELSIATFSVTYAQYNTHEDMQNYIADNFSEEQLMADVNSTQTAFYFATENDTQVGYIKVNYAPQQTDINDSMSLELERIYVLQEHQGKRAGQFLLNAALNIVKTGGLSYLWLGVWDKNTNARAFYAKNNFVAFGTHTFMLGNDEQIDILLRLDVV